MPPRNLDELVQRACAQILSDVELQELCSQTVEAKQVEAVLLQLLNAKTVASRTKEMHLRLDPGILLERCIIRAKAHA